MSISQEQEDRMNGLVNTPALNEAYKYYKFMMKDLVEEGFEEVDIMEFLKRKLENKWKYDSLLPTRQFLANRRKQ